MPIDDTLIEMSHSPGPATVGPEGIGVRVGRLRRIAQSAAGPSSRWMTSKDHSSLREETGPWESWAA